MVHRSNYFKNNFFFSRKSFYIRSIENKREKYEITLQWCVILLFIGLLLIENIIIKKKENEIDYDMLK